jgi:hypothetical protein
VRRLVQWWDGQSRVDKAFIFVAIAAVIFIIVMWAAY